MISHSVKNRLLSLLDLTNLSETATEADIDSLCKKAHTGSGQVASVCIYPKFIVPAKQALMQYPDIAICTVANFPDGDESIEQVNSIIQQSLNRGATEIDVVFPYQTYLAGECDSALSFINECRNLITKHGIFKVIIETSLFENPEQLYTLCRELLDLNVDFLKTSTGKIPIGATLPAARILLMAIKDSKKDAGFKASGGVRTIEDALSYFDLAKDLFSDGWVTTRHFRIGASGLLDQLLK